MDLLKFQCIIINTLSVFFFVLLIFPRLASDILSKTLPFEVIPLVSNTFLVFWHKKMTWDHPEVGLRQKSITSPFLFLFNFKNIIINSIISLQIFLLASWKQQLW